MLDNPGVSSGPPAPRGGLALVLGATLLTLGAGYVLKLPCLTSGWEDGRQYNRLCYSDPAALYGASDRGRGLDRDLVPYVQGDNEYPVLSGLAMYAAALPSGSYPAFFNWTALIMTGCALAIAWALHRMAGRRALLFALAPSLALYAFINWDLLAVAPATLATLAFLRGRDGTAGALLGLGAGAKLYPALLVVPFGFQRLEEDRPRATLRLAAVAAGTWVALNLPFALLGTERWAEFFRFNSERPADFDSGWFLLQDVAGTRFPVPLVNVLSAATFVAAAIVVWRVARARGHPTWTLGFPLIVLFLLTGKVYSPQFGLWLLPWFALVLPHAGAWAAFQAADVLVFVTRFRYFARLTEVGPGLPIEAFQAMLVLRMVVLVACLVVWVRRAPAESAPAPVPAMEAA
jgi:uncharacterized membrane protein